ncbi:MAG: choice-of-anchor U domain-containing protein [Mariprofundaceae bacterium]|nr:choice-of-anchor U domain-containing protein [Mariprofundaceae bacterium]
MMMLIFGATYAQAWEQHQLPTASTQSSTAHYGGNKAPLVLSPQHIMVAAADAQGMSVWQSLNDGISWNSTPLIEQNMAHSQRTQAYLASSSLLLAWGNGQTPMLFQAANISGSWSALPHVWPLANWNIVGVNTSTTGHIMVLATSPTHNKLVEGALHLLIGNATGWSKPIFISDTQALVGDAALVQHDSGLQSIIWSERAGNTWQIVARHSADNITWSQSMTVIADIAAPFFQEAAVHIAVDALNHEEIALAFTGWGSQAHSQVWSQAWDAISGHITHPLHLLPDAGDMVHQPSLVTLSNNTWAVAWQQKTGIDSEIYVAQHEANGLWSNAVNVSADPNHMDRDPHIALGSSHTLNIAFTRRMQADVQEVYTFAEGDIHDSSLDSDGDGIADSQELGFDLDHDGIDDAFSSRVATWSNLDGRYAFIMLGDGELSQVQAPSFAETGLYAPQSFDVEGSYFAFEIHALQVGQSTQVQLLTPHVLADDVAWLKLNHYQWQASEHTSFNAEHTGLIISLTDGGSGDEDGISNGIIVDPAVLATPKAITTSPSLNSSTAEDSPAAQSCLTPASQSSPWVWLMVLLFMMNILYVRPTVASHDMPSTD